MKNLPREEKLYPLALTVGLFVSAYASVHPEEVVATWEKFTT